MRPVTTVLLTLVGILLGGFHHAHASEQEHSTSTLIRQAAAEGRIAYERTTPEEFKQIAGKPTKERVSKDGEVVELEYPGVQVKFFGKPNLNTPVTILWVSCDGKNIDIGKNRYQKNVKVPLVQPFDKEQGKNPGLGVRRLHEKGITGRGVRVAILDQPLLVDHQEYVERVRLYEEIDLQGRTGPSMHGAAVASLAVGKTVGVAPEAELYYIAKYNFGRKGLTMRYITQGIDRILKINEQLPKDNKIRVISISCGWTPSVDGYDDVMAACEKSKAAGVFVVSCSLERVYGFSFAGLGRHPSADPDLFESYEPGLFWAKSFYNRRIEFDSDHLLVPMDSRTTASPGGNGEYVFHRKGGFSWSVPYIAGIYALAAQVEPDITPERFWNLALKTGRTIQLEHEGEKRPFGLIIDPVKLIRSISDAVGTSQQTTPKNTIMPGVGIGDYTLGMHKDDVLKKLGEPENIFYGGENYTLNNLPRRYFMYFGEISFSFDGDAVTGITAHSPLYKFANGLGVGDSGQHIIQAFGDDFHLKESEWKDFLTYEDKGIQFEIHKKDRTVMELSVFCTDND